MASAVLALVTEDGSYRCPACRYSLRGLEPEEGRLRCPECGVECQTGLHGPLVPKGVGVAPPVDPRAAPRLAEVWPWRPVPLPGVQCPVCGRRFDGPSGFEPAPKFCFCGHRFGSGPAGARFPWGAICKHAGRASLGAWAAVLMAAALDLVMQVPLVLAVPVWVVFAVAPFTYELPQVPVGWGTVPLWLPHGRTADAGVELTWLTAVALWILLVVPALGLAVVLLW